MELSEEPEQTVDLNDAVAFWQRELHYYESRAGDQGRQASGMIGIAAAAAVASAVAFGSMMRTSADSISENWTAWVFLILPALVLLLWATGLRLVHEMGILRTYTRHCARQLVALTDSTPTLAAYRTWEDVGEQFDRPKLHMTVWVAAAALVTAPGVLLPLGLTLMLAVSPGWAWGMALAVSIVLGLIVAALFHVGEHNEVVANDVLSGRASMADLSGSAALNWSSTGGVLWGAARRTLKQSPGGEVEADSSSS